MFDISYIGKQSVLGKSGMRLKENEIISELESQENLSPLMVDRVEQSPSMIGNLDVDVVITFSIQDGPSFKAAVDLLPISTPKSISQKINVLANYASKLKKQKLVPMIIAPYISKKESKLLIDQGISWIDLSGNMLIKVPQSIYIERTGKSNKFPDTSPIKKIYEGTSSLVCRALLLNPNGFTSLFEIVDFINNRNTTITIGTVSKVLKSLEEELIVSKSESKIRLKNPEVLLDNLTEGYLDYSKRKKDRKFRYDVENTDGLETLFEDFQIDYAYCGFYAAKRRNLGMTDQITIFIKSIQEVRKVFKRNTNIATPDEEYGQVILIETKNPCVWFNIQEEPFNNIVDDLELYLEMVNDKPRGPKIAKQLKERILGKFNGK
jgi:hypothetical protein